MLRRFFVFLLLFSFLVCFLAFSVSAASYNFTISFTEGDGYLAVVDSIPTSGTINYNITASYLGVPDALTSSGSGVLTSVEVEPGVYAYLLPFTFSDNPMPLVLTMASSDGMSVAVIDTPDYTLGSGYVFDVSLSTAEYPAFEVSTSTGLSSSISWVKAVIDSLISGDLVNLLAIGALSISISLLLLTAKLIRKFSWGS